MDYKGAKGTGTDRIMTYSENKIRTVNFIIDGGGSVVATGSKGFVILDFPCTIQSWTITGDQSGSAVVDVKRATYSGFPTTSSIAGTAKPTLSSVQKNQNTSLSGWGNTSIAAGDVLEFNVDSASTVTKLLVSIKVLVT